MSREMKDSGVEWIGEIPSHWGINMLTQLFNEVKCKNDNMQETNLLSLSYGKIKQRNINATGGLLPENFSGYNIIEANDIVLRLTDLQNDRTSLRVGLSTQRGIITSAYITLRNVSDANPKYLYYYLHSFDIRKGFYGMGSGVRQGLTFDGIKYMKIVLPPIKEQQAIAHYLDQKCTEIDSIIQNTRTSIEEYKMYKQSVITEVVTKGLNPNELMKDSGEAWIGEIPEHWEVCRLKLVANIVRGGSPRPAGDLRYYDGNIPFMKISDITKDDEIYVNSCVASIKEAGLSNTRMVNSGTLLLTNSGATLGVPKITTFDTTFNDGIAAFLDVKETINLLFMYYSLKAKTKWFLQVASMGQGQPNLNTDIIGNTTFVYPTSLNEQQTICDYLDAKCTEIDNLITQKHQIISELETYKKSLICECVTGKKEV
ncbi:restriction endonuclease subunit S [Paenibacillus andongensis]|uniref:restriction endonuclease subunit S n=1 Tax=Paenibacillus andongensis TaxID=2975482 RepID=UPI0021BBAAB1|nr:restriction endonuclease subunit S [Paenibacillus andongensis]